MKLIDTNDFVIVQINQFNGVCYVDDLSALEGLKNVLYNMAMFKKKPLEIGFFVPSVDGVPLVKPEHYDLWLKYGSFTQYGESIVSKCQEYFEADKRCLFKGFEVFEHHKTLQYKVSFGVGIIEHGNGANNRFSVFNLWKSSSEWRSGITNMEVLCKYGLELSSTAIEEIFGKIN